VNLMSQIKFDMVPYTRGVGLQISEEEKLFPHFIKWDIEALGIVRYQSLNFVCYIDPGDPDLDKIAEMYKLLSHGGFLNLVIPAYFSIHSITSQLTQCNVIEMFVKGNARFLAIKKHGGSNYGRLPENSEKTCAVLRYGGIGDMMMASCVFPELREQGYHITLFTHTNSYNVVSEDPFIDRFVLQESGQVPIEDYRDFVFHLMEKYDKVVNLSESIEGTLLALPDRVSYYWPKEARHKIMNKNCYQMTADIADVPLNLCGRFYRTKKERIMGEKMRKKFPGPIIIYVLSGSSIHKFWPYQDNLIAKILLKYPDANIFLVGDAVSQLLEQGWQHEPRVHQTSGKWSVRSVMAFCYDADLIITPETGVALGVQFRKVPKILLLSHSSVNNYVSSWKSAHPIEPEGCDCYPCHQLHYGTEFCTMVEVEDDDGEVASFSDCQLKIDPDRVFQKVVEILGE
jgi:ADP-heptose:LPS heptosyltransferase